MDAHITLSQHQIVCLLANAFLCTFPRRGTFRAEGPYRDYPTINFNGMFQGPGLARQFGKLRTIFHYFERLSVQIPNGNVSFHRRVLDEEDFPKWIESPKLLKRFDIKVHGSIEDAGESLLQVIFSNKFLGGGVLDRGCVQEEIRFLINPELIVSRLFTPELNNNECLFVVGAERFSNYSGYSDSFRFIGDYKDETPRDEFNRKKTHLVCLDAIDLKEPSSQYHPDSIERELNKAFCGFHNTNFLSGAPVASGNWGCGAFGGDFQLKSILQAMAATENGRDLVYFTFGNEGIISKQLDETFTKLTQSKVTVGTLWQALMEYYSNTSDENLIDFFDFLIATLA